MKSRTWICIPLITLITLMVASQPVMADTHVGRNVLGLATEPNASGVFEIADHPPGALQLHLMVYGYDQASGIKAWDCAVVLPEGVTLQRTELMGQGVNSYPQTGYFGVTTEEPLMPENGLVHLATLNLVVADNLPKDFYLAPAPIWGNIGGMEFSRATDESLRIQFTWPDGCNECPVFKLTNHPQAAEAPTLDWIKSLFR